MMAFFQKGFNSVLKQLHGQLRHSSSSSSSSSSFNVAIIGSGPAGFYTAHRLFTKSDEVHVDIFERLPTPFGLSRYGVAPDHPEVKNCELTFFKAAEHPNFRFFGNVTVGKDILLKELYQKYNAVVFAYGCTQERKLGVPGEDSHGVMSARQFVGWYNGLPEAQNLNPPLDQVKDVVIIGNGNVAIDVARILLTPVEVLEKTDITRNALKALQNSKVENIKIIARRGFLQSAFTNKEFRELIQLEQYGSKFENIGEWLSNNLGLDKASLAKLDKQRLKTLGRVNKRKLQLVFEQGLPASERKDIKYRIPEIASKVWTLEYLKTPIEIIPDENNENLIKSVKFQLNKLHGDDLSATASVEPIPGSFETTDAQLVITSIGYKGVPLPSMKELGIEFDTRRGVISNINGRLVQQHDKLLKGLYSAGWIKSGAKGVIAETMLGAFTTADAILEDFADGVIEKQCSGGEELHLQPTTVDWEDWEKLDEQERKLGEKERCPRVKITDVSKMLEVIRSA